MSLVFDILDDDFLQILKRFFCVRKVFWINTDTEAFRKFELWYILLGFVSVNQLHWKKISTYWDSECSRYRSFIYTLPSIMTDCSPQFSRVSFPTKTYLIGVWSKLMMVCCTFLLLIQYHEGIEVLFLCESRLGCLLLTTFFFVLQTSFWWINFLPSEMSQHLFHLQHTGIFSWAFAFATMVLTTPPVLLNLEGMSIPFNQVHPKGWACQLVGGTSVFFETPQFVPW